MAMEGIGGMMQQGMQMLQILGGGNQGGADSAQRSDPTQMIPFLGGAGGGAAGTSGGTSVSPEASPAKEGEPFQV